MRAVNLIPAGSGRAGGAGPSVGPWAVLGVLALLVAGMLAYVLTNNQITDRRAQLATLQTQVQAIQANADAVRPYKEFAALAQARVQTIRQLGAARFDWSRAFADLARVMPGDVWLTSLVGTVAPGVTVGGGSGDTGGLRGALPDPAIEISGCTTGHDEVARLISRLRLMTSVVRVALSASEKEDSGSGGGGGGPGGDCRYGHPNFAQFGIVVFFAPIPAVPAPTQPGAATAATPGAPAASTTPSAPAGSATPAASTTPAPGGTPVPSAGGPAGGPAGSAAAAPSGNGNGSGTR